MFILITLLSIFMKKVSLFSNIIFLLLLLSACNNSTSETKQSVSNDSVSASSSVTLNNDSSLTANSFSQQSITQVNHSADNDIYTTEMELSKFNEVEINCASEVEYVTNNEYAIKITTYEKTASNLDINVHDQKLRISLTGNNNYNYLKFTIYGTSKLEDVELTSACSFRNNGDLNPRGLDIDCNGASMITLNNISTSELNIDCDGASSANINNASCNNLDIDCNGASSIVIIGQCRNAEFEANGASSIDIKQLNCSKITKEEIMGASTLKK